MLAVKINNPEIENIFASQFDSDKDKFIDFISTSLQNLQNAKLKKLNYTKQDPFEHIQKNSCTGNGDYLCDVKPYSHISDSAEYIHNLRQQK